jgi:hypothetical protein
MPNLPDCDLERLNPKKPGRRSTSQALVHDDDLRIFSRALARRLRGADLATGQSVRLEDLFKGKCRLLIRLLSFWDTLGWLVAFGIQRLLFLSIQRFSFYATKLIFGVHGHSELLEKSPVRVETE